MLATCLGGANPGQWRKNKQKGKWGQLRCDTVQRHGLSFQPLLWKDTADHSTALFAWHRSQKGLQKWCWNAWFYRGGNLVLVPGKTTGNIKYITEIVHWYIVLVAPLASPSCPACPSSLVLPLLHFKSHYPIGIFIVLLPEWLKYPHKTLSVPTLFLLLLQTIFGEK